MQIGDIFNTPFESGCIVVSLPDEYGSFEAKDSDGVVCTFNLVMVEEIKSV